MKVNLDGIKSKIQNLKSKIFSKIFDLPKIVLSKSAGLLKGFIKLLKKPKMAIGLVLMCVIISVLLFQIKSRVKPKEPAPGEKPAVKGVGLPGQQAEMPQEPILVKVYEVQKKDFSDSLPFLGTVKGFKELELKFEVNGVLDSFNFKEGERVEEGEINATLDQRDALLKVKYNEIELTKTQKLFDIGAVIGAKLDQVKLEVKSAKRELDKTYLYAPRNGVLGTQDKEPGEFLTYTDRVATLIEVKEVFVEVGVVERDVGKVKVWQTGEVTVDTYPDKQFKGTVDNISPVVEGKSRTQTARIKVDNPEGLLLPGMFARATVAVYNAKGAIAIPNTAIDKTEEGYVTYVVKKDKKSGEEKPAEQEGDEGDIEEEGIAEARTVEADYRSADFFVVKEGVEEGDFVVIETQEKLKDGYKVIITETQEVVF